MFDEHKKRLVAFALGHHERGPGAHNKQRGGGELVQREWQNRNGKRAFVEDD